jgi:hypothetical protein
MPNSGTTTPAPPNVTAMVTTADADAEAATGDAEAAGALALSSSGGSSNGSGANNGNNNNNNYAFLVHSQETIPWNLPPDVDNKPLARQKRRRTRYVCHDRLCFCTCLHHCHPYHRSTRQCYCQSSFLSPLSATPFYFYHVICTSNYKMRIIQSQQFKADIWSCCKPRKSYELEIADFFLPALRIKLFSRRSIRKILSRIRPLALR